MISKLNEINLQKLESVAILAVTLYFYNQVGESWWWFLLWLIPDLGMIGYLANKKIGALTYNVAHIYLLPVLWLAAAYHNEETICMSLALIWISHIAIDRSLGYGLKKSTDFKHTHLGKMK